MNATASELVALTLLVAALGVAVVRPAGVNESLVAVPAAGLVVALGIVPTHTALATVRELAPTVAFLAAILAFGHLCAEAGVFDYLGARAARASGESTARLLLLVVVLASVVTATLTLDATVVLLTPVVLRTARRLRVPPRPHLYACSQLANAGSLVLPVSNLTNLLAFSASGLSFVRFTALMTLPWLAATALEWLGLRAFFRRDLRVPPVGSDTVGPAPRFALAVLTLTVLGFVVTSAVGVAPAWAAVAG
ncbi:MAG: SLC13 family permease, partial [Actinomycetota bacterium]|nr:SLC13 family permease [Actinomycetota bacterium]